MAKQPRACALAPCDEDETHRRSVQQLEDLLPSKLTFGRCVW